MQGSRFWAELERVVTPENVNDMGQLVAMYIWATKNAENWIDDE
jgi:hypothetical protein